MGITMNGAAVGAGFVLSGRYRLVEPLASGGMGTVWRALDLLLDRPVAVKEVRLPPGLDDKAREDLRRRTIREAQAAARLRHGAVVTIYDVVEHGGRPWIVMELVPSRSLAEIIRTGGPLPPARVAAIGLRVLDAMVAAAAAGVEHRDIKPANVLVTDEGRVVLTDFGIARHVGDDTLTSAGLIVGSPDYLAPERARGRPSRGLAADLWSLGATLYEAVEGRRPFERNGPLPTLAAVVMDEPDPPRLAGPLQPLIDRLLVKDPAHRLDADGTRVMLQRVLRGQPAAVTVPLPRRPVDDALPLAPTAAESGPAVDTQTTAYPPEPPTEEPTAPPPPERRRRTALLAGLVVLVLVAVAAVLVPVLSGGGQDEATGPTTPSVRPTNAASSSQPTTANSPTAGRTTASRTTASPATAAPTQSTASSPVPATGSRVTPPAGFIRYTDPRDRFSVVVPSGWRPIRRDTRVDFDDPASSRFLRIDTSDRPLPDPYQNWIDYERQFRQGKSDYRLIGIRRVQDYRPEEGWTTADWEFTLGGTHVLDRNIRVSDTRAHAIYWSTPQNRWDAADSRQILRLAEQSFVPAPIG
jgi:eukaryotic-like serine/threonine-protein kinase